MQAGMKNKTASADCVRRRGFTVLELLVVVSVIGMLLSLVLPAVLQAREAARRTDCLNNLKQIALAVHNFHSVQGSLPEGNAQGRLWTFQARLLPYLDRSDLYDRIDFNFPDYCFYYGRQIDPANDPRSVVIDVFSCPADANAGKICERYARTHGRHATTSYLGVSGSAPDQQDGLFFSGSHIRLGRVTDGTSNTLMLGERGVPSDLEMGWAICAGGERPDDSGNMDNLLSAEYPIAGSHNEDNARFWSYHSGIVNFAFADGSVRPVSDSISHDAFVAMATRHAGDNLAF